MCWSILRQKSKFPNDDPFPLVSLLVNVSLRHCECICFDYQIHQVVIQLAMVTGSDRPTSHCSGHLVSSAGAHSLLAYFVSINFSLCRAGIYMLYSTLFNASPNSICLTDLNQCNSSAGTSNFRPLLFSAMNTILRPENRKSKWKYFPGKGR